MSALHAALAVAQQLQVAVERTPLRWIDWTVPQDRWHRLRPVCRRKLLRAGNQVGKTFAGLAEVVWRCLGTHPHYPTHTPPIEAWIVCSSWQQSVAIMKKFWDFVPKDQIKTTRFSVRSGFGKENPTVEFHNGSVVRFKTAEQGPKALASGTVHCILVDELCTSDVYRELERRVLRTAGVILLTLTPINNPAKWLSDEVAKGNIEEVHATFIEESFRHAQSGQQMRLLDGTVMDATWCVRQRAQVLPYWAPIILDGEWETRATDRVLEAFDGVAHIVQQVPDEKYTLCIGIDYGSKIGKQVAVLVGLTGKGRDITVTILDEQVDEHGRSTPEEDVQGLLDMLMRNGLEWGDLDYAYGDRLYVRGAEKKANAKTQAILAELIGVSPSQVRPPILTVKRGAGHGRGSVDAGLNFLHNQMLREGRFRVVARCKHVITAIEKWDGKDDEHKDKIDALRYALDKAIFSTHGNRGIRALELFGGRSS